MSIISLNPGDIVFKVLEYRKNEKDTKLLNKAIRESIKRELKFNQALIFEAKNAMNRKPSALEAARVLLQELKTDAFYVLTNSGFPLNEIFEGNLDHNFKPKKAHQSYVKNVKTEADLLEKTYHRITILKVLLRAGIEKRKVSWEYLLWLIDESLRVIK